MLVATCPLLRCDTLIQIYGRNVWLYQNHQCQNTGPAHIATVYIIFQTVVLFVAVDLQILHPTRADCPTFVETSTIEEGVHNHIVPFATCASSAQVPIQGSSAPTHQGSPLTTLDIRCPRHMLPPHAASMATHSWVRIMWTPWQNFRWAASVRHSTRMQHRIHRTSVWIHST